MTLIWVWALFFVQCTYQTREVSLIPETEKEFILDRANSYLDSLPVTVTSSFCSRSKGNIHDYYSESDYWWPDSLNPGGAYIKKDGLSNPDNFLDHRRAMRRLSVIVPTLTSAFLLTGEREYADWAIKHLRAWFTDSTTGMNPHLLYSQAIPGSFSGRSYGIIDTIHLVEVVQAVIRLEKGGMLKKKEFAELRNWFEQYLVWLTNHEFGMEERNHGNNHGTCWVMQVASFAELTENDSLLKECRQIYKERLLPEQMAKDGSFPRELERTKPYCYSLFNLDAMTTLCRIASTPENNLWEYSTGDGRSIKTAVEFMYPFVKDKRRWPFPKDVMYDDQWPMRHASFFFAYEAFQEDKYLELWKTLPFYSDEDEVIRNFFVRQPILWIKK